MSNPEQDILKELEGIVNAEFSNMHDTYQRHQKRLITDLNREMGEDLEVGTVRVCVATLSDQKEYDSLPETMRVGIDLETAEAEGLIQDGVGTMAGLITLPERRFISEFFGDNELMLAMEHQHSPKGYCIHTEYKSGKTLTLFVKEQDLLVFCNGEAYTWEYTEQDREQAEKVLGAKSYEYLCLMIQALHAPKVFRKEHPRIFEALAQEVIEKHKHKQDQEDEEN